MPVRVKKTRQTKDFHMSVTATIRIQQADFDVAQEIAALSQGPH